MTSTSDVFVTRSCGPAAAPRCRSGGPKVSLPPDLTFFAPTELHLLGCRIEIHDADPAAVRMLSPLLEWRLLRRFREAGVGYSISSEPVLTSWENLFVIVLPAHDLSFMNLKPTIDQELKAIHDGTFTDEELAEAREVIAQRLIAADALPAELLNELVTGQGVEGWYGPDILTRARSLTRAELVAAVEPWLSPDAVFYVHFTPTAARPAPPTRAAQEASMSRRHGSLFALTVWWLAPLAAAVAEAPAPAQPPPARLSSATPTPDAGPAPSGAAGAQVPPSPAFERAISATETAESHAGNPDLLIVSRPGAALGSFRYVVRSGGAAIPSEEQGSPTCSNTSSCMAARTSAGTLSQARSAAGEAPTTRTPGSSRPSSRWTRHPRPCFRWPGNSSRS